jgi:hypothetical protein
MMYGSAHLVSKSCAKLSLAAALSLWHRTRMPQRPKCLQYAAELKAQSAEISRRCIELSKRSAELNRRSDALLSRLEGQSVRRIIN